MGRLDAGHTCLLGQGNTVGAGWPRLGWTRARLAALATARCQAVLAAVCGGDWCIGNAAQILTSSVSINLRMRIICACVI